MSEQKKTSLTKVYTKRGIWVKTEGGAKKVQPGNVIELSAEDIKTFGKAVTKDIPEELE